VKITIGHSKTLGILIESSLVYPVLEIRSVSNDFHNS